jgi:predicted O-methyltransferase YrrM
MAPWSKEERMSISIDAAVEKVLAEYQQRIETEGPRLQQAMRDGTLGSMIDEFLLPVGPDAGRLINILAKSKKVPTILELGTSFGYSGIWLAEAARATGGRLITMELSESKSKYAREMSQKAGLAEFVDFRVGDAVKLIGELSIPIDFVLVDLWKDLYLPCLEAFYPKLNAGALIVSDNMIEPASSAKSIMAYQAVLRAKPRITSVLVAVGSGLEISRFD